MDFEIQGRVSAIEVIAGGSSIRELAWIEKAYGPGRWRKLKGTAWVRLRTEVHWYEAHGVGRREIKVKRLL